MANGKPFKDNQENNLEPSRKGSGVPTQYYLPCPCGTKLTVDSRQAGHNITCRCGAKLEIPTLRGLDKLEPAPPAAHQTAARVWTPRQGLVLLGSVLAVLGVTIAGVLWWTLPVRPKPDVTAQEAAIRQQVDALTPQGSLDLWRRLLRDGLTERPSVSDIVVARRLQHHWRWIYLAWGLAAIGLVLATGAVAMPTSGGT